MNTSVFDADAFPVRYIVGVVVPDTVLADAFHDAFIGPPMEWRVT